MTTTLSRTSFPPGGWVFRQAQTGWSAPTPISSTFDQTVRLIIEMRRKNPAACVKHNLSLDPAEVGKELESFTRRRLGIPLPTPALPSTLIPGIGALATASIDEIKKLINGAGIVMDWEKSGQDPVSQTEAEVRSKICAQCPLNSSEKLAQWKTVPVASTLKSRTPRLSSLNLKTDSDARLGLCEGLYCPCTYLVHEPLPLIAARLKSQVDGKCWIIAK